MAAIELREAMSTLRAVRRLRPDPIPDDVLRRVLQAATWAPSGGNRQAWRAIETSGRAVEGGWWSGSVYSQFADQAEKCAPALRGYR